jgi:hypothetical protein
MKNKDVADVAGWAHKVNEKFPWTTELHYQVQPDRQCYASQTEKNCKDNHCLLQALKYFYGLLTDEPKPDLKLKSGVKFTDADSLKYLINLLGDLHQPLHLGFESDESGKKIQASYRGQTTDLFTFVNARMAASVIQTEQQFWWSGWTNIRAEEGQYTQDQRTWKDLGVNAFNLWANETSRVVCDQVMTDPTTGKALAQPGGTVTVGQRLYSAWRRDVLLTRSSARAAARPLC